MEPLKMVDEGTPSGARVIVIADGGMSLLLGVFSHVACGWAHVAGKDGETTLRHLWDVFEFPEVPQ